jgi:hypothetical protein
MPSLPARTAFSALSAETPLGLTSRPLFPPQTACPDNTAGASPTACVANPGFFSGGGGSTAITCPSGYYCAGGSAVARCPVGTSSAKGAVAAAQCSVLRAYYGR